MTWQDDKAWSSQFMPDVKRILADDLIVVANSHQDQREATDLVVLEVRGGHQIGVRIRRPVALRPYGFDVTMRTSRPSGAETEFSKIMAGWCHWFFYGFGDDATGRILACRLLNMDQFRIAFRAGQIHGTDSRNRDGSSGFVAFDVRKLPIGIVVRSHSVLRGVRIGKDGRVYWPNQQLRLA